MLLRAVFGYLVLAPLSIALAWGGRGHDAICESAIFLVKEKPLQEFLRSRPHVMGHLCNVPDIYWRSLPPELDSLGAPTHFIDPEVIGLSVSEIPSEYVKIESQFTGKPNKFREGSLIGIVAKEFGSLWWRADQFLRTARALNFANAAPPTDKAQEQDQSLPYNQVVYALMVNLGLAGHFVGDASQPLHNTADYDGWQSGHGGLHGYYEDVVVAQFGDDLVSRITGAARKVKNPTFLKGTDVIAKMRALSEISQTELAKVTKLDPVIKTSLPLASGGKRGAPAERADATKGFRIYANLVTTDMARAALLLAHLWDETYISLGRPDLSHYRSYKYPLTPEFIAPDYISKKNPEPSAAKSGT